MRNKIAMGGIMAEAIRACESAKKHRPPLERVGHRDGRGGRSNISNETQYVVFFVELLHGFDGPRRLIAVVGRDQPEYPTFHAARVVNPVESGVYPELPLVPELLCRTGKRRRDSEPAFAVGYAAGRDADRR